MANKPFDIIDSDLSDILFRIQLKVGDKEFEGDVRPDLKVDYDNLEEQMERIPSQYAYWGMVYSEAKRTVAILDKRARLRRGQVARELLNMAREEKIRLHRGDIEDLVETDAALLKLEISLADANRTAGKLWNVSKALEIKSDVLRSLAGFKRQEQHLSR